MFFFSLHNQGWRTVQFGLLLRIVAPLVSTYQKWCKKGQPMNQHQGHGCTSLTGACGEWRRACLGWSHRRATVAQIGEKLNADHDRQVSEHQSVLRVCVWGGQSKINQSAHDDTCSPAELPQLACEHQHWTLEQWEKVACSDDSQFSLEQVDGWVCMHRLDDSRVHYMRRRQASGGVVVL